MLNRPKKLFNSLYAKHNILAISFYAAIFLVSFLIYSYKLPSSYTFNTDIARDADEMIQVAQGRLTLIGPMLNFGGFHAGPYYYYLFAPILLISKFNLDFVLIFNALLFSAGLVYLFKKISKKYSMLWAFICSWAFAILPLYLLMSRNPGNAYSYLPFLLIFLTYVYFNNVQKTSEIFLLGLLAGIIVNFHPLNAIVFLPIVFYLLLNVKKKSNILLFILGGFVSYMPLIFFEIRHDFVIFKKMAFDFGSGNLPISANYQEKQAGSFLENYLNSVGVVSSLVLFSPTMYTALSGLQFLKFFRINAIKKRGSHGLKSAIFSFFSSYIPARVRFEARGFRSPTMGFFCFSSIVSFFLYALAFNGSIGPHYVFPFAFFMFFSLVLFLLNSNFKYLIILIIIMEIAIFNTDLYKDTQRPKDKFERAVNFAIDNELVKKTDAFNIIQDVNKVPAGHEYRFFFRARGFQPKTINEYNVSNVLLIFSETNDFDMAGLKNWETGQFGQEYFHNFESYSTGEIDIYLVKKN